MAKLKLNPEPIFKAKVPVPVPGAGTVDVEFSFKHRTRQQLKEWVETKDVNDAQSVVSCTSAWDLDDQFDEANVSRLCDNYAGAAFAIVQVYIEELRGARLKN